MNALDIGEVAERSGLAVSTLRFYEEKGLIRSVGRRGLRRLFDPQVMERLALITLGRASGFSLEEIARMFAADGRPNIDRKMLAAKADELDRTIRELSAMRNGLRHAAACRAPSHMECPTFRRLLARALQQFPAAMRSRDSAAPSRAKRSKARATGLRSRSASR